jgi:hypothetical protein
MAPVVEFQHYRSQHYKLIRPDVVFRLSYRKVLSRHLERQVRGPLLRKGKVEFLPEPDLECCLPDSGTRTREGGAGLRAEENVETLQGSLGWSGSEGVYADVDLLVLDLE